MSDMRVITSSNKLLLLLLAPKCGPKRQFVTVVPHLASTTGPKPCQAAASNVHALTGQNGKRTSTPIPRLVEKHTM